MDEVQAGGRSPDAPDVAGAPREPLAIVGVGLRLPGGVSSLADLRAMLLAGRTGVREVPADRWDAAALYHPDFRKRGHVHTTRGGFLDEVDLWDAGFFGIAPTEAVRMDPQQRLALEVAHEALEDAGLRLDEVAGARASSFVGVGNYDWGTIQTERARIGPTSNTGSAGSIVANRIAFLFDLRGPSVAVDTACSSALTALHLACQTLWDGTCDLALAGGVNLILRPESSIGFSKGGYLSPDGECRAFSDDANGYVRSEGAAIAVLMPLARARAEGRRIHGLVRATASNQDGRTPGMTMPSQAAQEDMLRAAYARAGVDPARVAYVEAHGTGTPVGDPIEATAIGRVLGAGRPADRPLWLGSVKTNVGHLETAAGMAGLLKLLLVLGDRTVYPNRLLRAPNPAIDWEGLRLRVATAPVPLADAGPLVGGVNAFGFGGTNAHAVVEGPPEPSPRPEGARRGDAPDGERQADGPGPHLVLASARSEPALRAVALGLAGWLREAPHALPAACAALHRQRTAFPFRLALTGRDRDGLARALEAWGQGGPAPGLRTARRPDTEAPQAPVLVFSGQGPQWWGMGRELLATSPRFRARVEAVERDLVAHGWLSEEAGAPAGEPEAAGEAAGAAGVTGPLTRELLRDEATSRIGETRVAQPALFALQLGLWDLLRAHGVAPAAVIGHSIGELAAAVAAGALDAGEAARVVVWRSRCQAAAEGRGAMAAVGVAEAEAPALLAPWAGRLELAAVNGPRGVTVAGEHAAVAALEAACAAAGTFFRRLDVSVPFHCFLMDPVEARFRAGLGAVSARAGALPFVSTVTGGPLPGDALDAGYWWRNVREPVRFHAGVQALLAAGHTRFVEVAPHPVLGRSLRDALEAAGVAGSVVATLARGEPEAEAVLAAVGGLFLANVPCRPVCPPDADGPDGAGPPPRVLDLPRYPFQRRRWWLETPQAAALRRGGLAHPVVGRPEPSTESRRRFTATITVDPEAETYLQDHHVQGLVVLPGAGQLEAAHAAGALAWGSDDLHLEDVVLRLPISLPPEGDPPEFRFEVYGDEGHFQIASRRPGEPGAWSVHTRGRLNVVDPFPARAVDLAAVRARVTEVLDHARFYAGMAETGLALGPCFQGIVELRARRETAEVLTRVEVPAALEHELGRYRFHPALLDAVFQGSSLASFNQAQQGLFLPHRVRRMKFHRRPDGRPLWCWARLEQAREGEVELEVFALDPDGRTVVELHGFVLKLVAGSAPPREAAARRPYYEPAWEPAPALGAPRPLTGTTWLLLAPGGAGVGPGEDPGPAPGGAGSPAAWAAFAEAVRGELAAAGARVVTVHPGAALRALGDPRGSGPGRASPPDAGAPDRYEARAAGEDAAALVAALRGEGQPDQPGVGALDGLVHLASLDVDGPEAAVLRGSASLTGWVAALTAAGAWRRDGAHPTSSSAAAQGAVAEARAAGPPADPRPVVLAATAGAWPQAGRPGRPWGGAVWGAGRTLRNEEPRVATTLVDLPLDPAALGEALPRALCALLAAPAPPTELRLGRAPDPSAPAPAGPPPADGEARGDAPPAPASTPAAALAAGPGAGEGAPTGAGGASPGPAPAGGPPLAFEALRLRPAPAPVRKRIDVRTRAWRARLGQPGVLDSARLVEARRRAPGPREVEVEVEAASLNFKDVVVGMGLLDRGAWEGGMSGAELGMDLAGVVTAVGEEVAGLAPGDRVLGMANGALASHVVVDAVHVIPRPAGMDAALAAALPTVFLTADVALDRLARLGPGETVLVHAAAGGVGTAAVQLAHALGARVLGTASSPRKREHLAALGVTTVFDSRRPSFREGVLEATGGRGVDVVLNALSGDALLQSVRCLAPFGRFVEIGKLDLAANRQLGLEPFAWNLSYHALDLNRWVAAFKEEGNRRMRVLASKVAAGLLRMPVETFPAERLADALRHLAQARHVGKVVVLAPRPAPDAPPAARLLEVDAGARALFRRDGTYVVTGGCSGFGLEVARWIGEQGGGALLLLGRRGLEGDDAERARAREVVAALEARGVHVLAPPCDVADPAALALALARARAALPPLRGVFHAAMVLDDGAYAGLDPARHLAVARPKLAGAWHLDRLTTDDPLEHFVCFASIAGVLGTPGQANYAAANAALDALARARRARGRPGLSLALGPLEGAGVLARASEDTRRKVLAQGVEAFGVARALEVLEEALTEEPVERLAALVDWGRMPRGDPAGREVPAGGLARGEKAEGAGESFAAALRALPAAERPARVIAWTAEYLAQVAGLEAREIDPGSSLTRLGIDSLMATQLLAWLQARFGVEVPLVRLMQGPTLAELADEVARQVG